MLAFISYLHDLSFSTSLGEAEKEEVGFLYHVLKKTNRE
jgi:hypothetical protein